MHCVSIVETFPEKNIIIEIFIKTLKIIVNGKASSRTDSIFKIERLSLIPNIVAAEMPLL